MHADNVRCETFEEHDIYMDELLKSLKTADKNGITEDPFIYVEKHMERYPMYDETTHRKLRKPKVGEKYVSVAQFKECVTYYALENGFSLWLSDPEKGKQRKQTRYPSASSDELPTCLWRCYARPNPDIRLCDIVDLVIKKYKCKVNPNQCINAKKYALTEYEKTVGEHYAMLRSYGKSIVDSNPRSTVRLGVTVNPDDKTYFDRFYVCFAGLADGWEAGCKKIIALDGCFLKSLNQGEILTTIGKDGNNHIYPVAWAVINVKNIDNWTWFLELLVEDLGSSRGNGLTFMVLWKPGRPRKKQSDGDLEDVDVVLRGPVRDKGDGGSRVGASGSRGRGGAGGSRGGASRCI
ncbi:multidrug resistance-associated protein 5 [Tanacetum coccineum]